MEQREGWLLRVRKVDASGDMVFGGDQAAFWVNNKEGVGQIGSSRMRLWTGQWWLKIWDGTPYQVRVLGKYTENTRDAAIQGRILSTPGVLSMMNYASSLNRDTRAWTVSAEVNTIYGPTTITGAFA